LIRRTFASGFGLVLLSTEQINHVESPCSDTQSANAKEFSSGNTITISPFSAKECDHWNLRRSFQVREENRNLVGQAKTRKPNLPKSLELNKGLFEILPPLTFKVKQQLVFAMSSMY
jgi:hypothetical protein